MPSAGAGARVLRDDAARTKGAASLGGEYDASDTAKKRRADSSALVVGVSLCISFHSDYGAVPFGAARILSRRTNGRTSAFVILSRARVTHAITVLVVSRVSGDGGVDFGVGDGQTGGVVDGDESNPSSATRRRRVDTQT